MFPKHPTRTQLILYAESILDGKGPIYSGIARHVSKCQQCREEVEAIKNSLRFFNNEVIAEPTEELTNEIIKRVREANKKRRFERTATKYRRPYVTVMCCAILWGLVGYFTFGHLYLKSDTLRTHVILQPADSFQFVQSVPTLQKNPVGDEDSLLWHQIEILNSVLIPILNYADIKTYPYIKMVSILDDEMEKARKALEKCPEDERVRKLIRDNMREKVEVLKRIYYRESVL